MSNLLKLTTLIVFLNFVVSPVLGCNNSTISIANQTTNPNGSITYTLDLCVELGTLDATFYGFALVFNSSTSTPVVDVSAAFPTTTTISTSTLTSGNLSGILQGLTGSTINSVAGDSDWNQFQNMNNVLSFESSELFGATSNDICMQVQVTVMGCVEDIDFYASVNSGSSSCIHNAVTGQNCCSAPILLVSDPFPICNPSTVDLTASSITAGSDPGTLTYWTDNSATSSLGNPSAVSSSGVYYIQLESSGCVSIEPVNVVVNLLPNLTITDPSAVCSPSTVDLTGALVTAGSDQGLLTYWTDPSAMNSLSNPSSVSNGTYYIQLESSGCFSTQAVNVVVNAQPSLIVTDPPSLCSPSTVDLTDISVTAGSDPGMLTYWADPAATIPLGSPSSVSNGVYYLQLESNACFTIQSVNATVNASPNLLITDPAALCSPSTIDLTASAITAGSDPGVLSYWTDPAASNVLSAPSSVGDGTYYVQLEANGCSSVVAVNAVINAAPNLLITDPAALCSPSTIDLTLIGVTAGSDPGTLSYWTDPIASTSLSNPSSVSSGTYYILLDNGNCTAIEAVNASVLSNSTANFNATICPGGAVVYNGTTYDSNNLSGTEILVAANGCDSIVNVAITVQQSVSGSFSTSICENDSLVYNGTVYNSNNLSGSDTLVSSGGCDSIVTVTIGLLLNSTAAVNATICSGDSFSYNGVTYDANNLSGIDTLQSASGCDSIVTVTVIELPALSSSLDSTICFGESFEFNGTEYGNGNLSGTEVFSSVDGCDSLVDVTVIEYQEFSSILDTTVTGALSFDFNGSLYTEDNPSGSELFVSSTGCDSTVFVNVVFENEAIFFVPDGFSPNGDGTNDYLYVMGVGLQEVSFKIFNRWGELVFQTDCCCQQSCGWDGTLNGIAVNNGAFVYLLEGLDINGVEVFSKGTISLIK